MNDSAFLGRFATVTLRLAFSIVMAFGLAAPLAYGGPSKTDVDSGTFTVFVNRQPVATEHFQIQKTSSGSTATSEFKFEGGDKKSAQRADLQLTPMGDLRRYEWRELNPGKAHLEVEPSDDILVEQITPNPPEKLMKHPFMLPRSTVILDDYIFSQREILAWRYLALACNGTLQQCRPGPLQFGALIPQQRSAVLVTVEYSGQEKVNVGGQERDLNRLKMKAEDVEWFLYLDSSLKLVRISIPSENTEVVRN